MKQHQSSNYLPLSLRVVDGLLAVIVGSYLLSAVVGFPLFGDGAFYWFSLAVDQQPIVPNLRFSALLPQLPAILLSRFSQDPIILRYALSFSYAMVPVISLLSCWFLVRRKTPFLLIFPLLWIAIMQINYSAVSELLIAVHLTWPLVFAVVFYQNSLATLCLGYVLGVVLLAIHPLSFILGAAISILVLHRHRSSRNSSPLINTNESKYGTANHLVWLGVWFFAMSLLRALITVLSLNDYERSMLRAGSVEDYLVPVTLIQSLYLACSFMLGIFCYRYLRSHFKSGRVRLAPQYSLRLNAVSISMLLISFLVALEIYTGIPTKPKSGLSFIIGVLLIMLAYLSCPSPKTLRSHCSQSDAFLGALKSAIYSSVAAIVMIMMVKSLVWSQATHQLWTLVSGADPPCIVFTDHQPSLLKQPNMIMLNNWSAPFSALAFRPFTCKDCQSSLLLPYTGCAVLDATNNVNLTHWATRPWTLIDSRVGPLRKL